MTSRQPKPIKPVKPIQPSQSAKKANNKTGFLSIKKVILAIFIVGALFVCRSVYIYFELYKVIRTANMEDGSSVEMLKKPPFPAFAEKLAHIKDLPQDFNELLNKQVSYKKDFINNAEIVEVFSKRDQEEISLLRSEIRSVAENGIETIPETPVITEKLDIRVPSPPYKEARNTLRYWYLCGRYFHAIKDDATALNLNLASLVLLKHIENSGEDSVYLITGAMSTTFANMVSNALLEITSELVLPADLLKTRLKELYQLYGKRSPITYFMLGEKRFLPAVSPVIFNENMTEKYVETYYRELIKAYETSYSEAIKTAKEKGKLIGPQEMNLETIVLSLVKAVFRPKNFCAEFLASMCNANYERTFEYDFKSRQLANGALVALTLRCYELEKGRLPDSLQELENWFGLPMPNDVYTNAPMQYNPKSNKVLFSVGSDLTPDTNDDLVFVPYLNRLD